MLELPLARCTIRSWRAEDAASVVSNANNRNVWRNLLDGFPHPYTLADAENWIRLASGGKPETHFAIEVNGMAVGGIGFHMLDDVYRRTARIGYWLGEAYWNRGIATEALAALTTYALSRFDFARIEATVFEWNTASGRVLEKAGYTLEARLRKRTTKDGRTVDEFMYARVRD